MIGVKFCILVPDSLPFGAVPPENPEVPFFWSNKNQNISKTVSRNVTRQSELK